MIAMFNNTVFDLALISRTKAILIITPTILLFYIGILIARNKVHISAPIIFFPSSLSQPMAIGWLTPWDQAA